ncbi:inositol monophosphatase family protein [Altererythrobacter aquiaggeris]|uniref:inositol monophosphatase family protein n=1 Tax=Aestuarierythrobacter aquiaggeris TaxID=1898396 RepID=UPI003015BC88
MNLSKDLILANRLADAAGAVIRPRFRGSWSHERKADASPVTEVDKAAEAAMRAILESAAADDGIIGEEYGTRNEGAGRQWVLDPIDGTISFMAGRPIFGTLIALLQDGWPVLGIIDQPVAGERWAGQIGKPTTLNGDPVRVRACRELSEATLASSGPQYFSDADAAAFMSLAAQTSKTVIWGGDCYNYGLLASGNIDIVCESGLKLYDYAALVPIVEGAGGLMADWQGNPLDADSDGRVLALGEPARLEEALEAMR